jgi:hypothetical protein
MHAPQVTPKDQRSVGHLFSVIGEGKTWSSTWVSFCVTLNPLEPSSGSRTVRHKGENQRNAVILFVCEDRRDLFHLRMTAMSNAP